MIGILTSKVTGFSDMCYGIEYGVNNCQSHKEKKILLPHTFKEEQLPQTRNEKEAMHRESRNTVRLLTSVVGSRVYKDDKKWKDEKKERYRCLKREGKENVHGSI